MNFSFLDTPIEYLKGVGPARADVLRKEAGIHTFGDLLHYFPYKYIDRTKIYPISEVNGDMPFIQVIGQITKIEKIGKGPGERLKAELSDGTGAIELVWFKGFRWILSSLKPNTDYLVFGKPSVFMGRINIPHPEIEIALADAIKIMPGYRAVYPLTEKLSAKGLNSRGISRLVGTLLEKSRDQVLENLPDELVKKFKCIDRYTAFFQMHCPDNLELRKKAEFRLKFEELFFIQIRLLRTKIIRNEKGKGLVFQKVGDYVNRFYREVLPFTLTEAQKKVIREIRKDLGSGKQMNRLLQGDVGSGKTLVALMSVLIALDNGFQACIMAPTEILANQHFRTISGFLGRLGIETGLITGSVPKKEKKVLCTRLEKGELRVVTGTHSLIQDEVRFNNLGLAVIDEQHKFGVAQRAELWKKNTPPPHVLVMTATPIPRTLAMTIYGDLDVSVIDEMPPGRRPVVTYHRYDTARLKVYHFISEQIQKGRQAYIVYPLIEESESLDYKNLLSGYEQVVQFFPEPAYKVCMVHGRMDPMERDAAMQKFIAGEANILVATNVIEVGVDIANATVMIIESAERFGLSQLHQLRGRVGRGAEQSFCILLTRSKLSAEAVTRVNVMCRTNDGFEIAEQDLKLRGPGDLEGIRQSGLHGLKISNLAKDGLIVSAARSSAMDILRRDPSLQQTRNRKVKEYLDAVTGHTMEWGRIS